MLDDKYIQIINELLKGNEIDEKELDDCVKIFCEKKGVNESKKAIGIYDTYRYIFDKALKIVIIPTLACNFRCVYCYENHDSYIINEEFENNLYLAIIDFIKKHDMRLLAIEWFGGEPLLAYNNIIRFTKKMKEWCIENNVEYGFSMTTNGYLLSLKKYEKLCSLGFTRFIVTLDGFEHTHNKYRYLKNGEGTWKRIFNNLLFIYY